MLDSTLVTLSLAQRAQTPFWLQKTNKGNIAEGEKERVKVWICFYVMTWWFEQLPMKAETESVLFTA